MCKWPSKYGRSILILNSRYVEHDGFGVLSHASFRPLRVLPDPHWSQIRSLELIAGEDDGYRRRHRLTSRLVPAVKFFFDGASEVQQAFRELVLDPELVGLAGSPKGHWRSEPSLPHFLSKIGKLPIQTTYSRPPGLHDGVFAIAEVTATLLTHHLRHGYNRGSDTRYGATV